ncbi:MAG: transcription antitermination factor NusB [Nitrospirae bacterium]|nr:transcription antitermination factor NusB [Nitrospirota bacterium]
MKRRKAREHALQFLYRIDFSDGTGGKTRSYAKPGELKSELDSFWNEAGDVEPEVKSFAEDIITGTIKNLETIDSVIQRIAEKWTLSRIASIDRNILRLAAYELLFRKDIPGAVTINEALEIAKKYSTAESASFINGLLDRIVREYCAKEPDRKKKK